jgi:hypothetical protein
VVAAAEGDWCEIGRRSEEIGRRLEEIGRRLEEIDDAGAEDLERTAFEAPRATSRMAAPAGLAFVPVAIATTALTLVGALVGAAH